MKKLLSCLFLLLASVAAFAQGDDLPPIDINTLQPETLINTLVEPIYSALIILFGYLSAFIPGVKKWSPFVRVITFALAAGLGFWLFGVSFWKIAVSYLFSSGLYATVLKNIFPTPKPAPAGG